MTSPNIGSAEVDIDARVDESELADAARRAGRRAGDSGADSFIQRFRRRLRQRLDGGFDVFTGGSAARSAASSGAIYATRFSFAFRRAFARSRDLFSRLRTITSGDLAAVEIGARAIARRFGARLNSALDLTPIIRRVRSAFSGLAGPEVSVILNDGSERLISGQAARLGRLFTTSFSAGIARSRGLIGGVFGRGGLVGELIGRGLAATTRLLGSVFARAVGAVPRLVGVAAGAFTRLGNVLFTLGSIALSAFGVVGKGLSLFTSGLGRVLGPLQRYVALAGALALVTVPFIPVIGRLYNGLLDIAKGFGVFLPAGIAAAALSFTAFKLGADGLKQAVSPLREAFSGLSDELSATFLRGGIQNASRLFARVQVPAIRRGLAQLTAGYRDFIANGLNAGAITAFGSALERVGTNTRGFLDNFSGALVPIATVLNRMLTQVSDTFPELGRRLESFFAQLEVRSRDVDFGEIFLNGLQGAVNLTKAIGEAGLALSEFFTAAVGGDTATSAQGDGPFAGLLAQVRRVRTFIRENRGDIESFFSSLGTILGKLGTGARVAGNFLKDTFEPLRVYFTSAEFKDGFREIEEALGRLSKPGDGKKSQGTVFGETLASIASTVVTNGPAVITFMRDLKDILEELQPLISGAAEGLERLDLGKLFSDEGNIAAVEGAKIGRTFREALELAARSPLNVQPEEAGNFVTRFFGDMQRDFDALKPEIAQAGRDIKSALVTALTITPGELGASITGAVGSLATRLRELMPQFSGIGPVGVRLFSAGFTFRGLLGISLTFAIQALLRKLRELLPSFPSIGLTAVQGFIRGFAGRPTIGGGLIGAAQSLLGRLQEIAGQIAAVKAGIGEVATNPVGNARRGLAELGRGLGRIGGRADGGLVTRPEISWIGEAGPELVLPLTRPKRTQQLLAEAGLVQNTSSSRVEVRAPIHVHGGAGADPLAIARETERQLMRMVR